LGLYGERWEIELRFRDIKTTLEMEKLAVKTPEMAHKTLWIMMIAYNLVRSQMQEAAHMAKVEDMVDFCCRLFGLRKVQPEAVLSALTNYVGVVSTPSGISLEWELLYTTQYKTSPAIPDDH